LKKKFIIDYSSYYAQLQSKQNDFTIEKEEEALSIGSSEENEDFEMHEVIPEQK
jgi:hypothetical protein